MKKFLLVLLVIVGALAAYVATRPSEFRIARSAVIAAPPEIVFANLDDFRRWQAWSPWEKRDPNMRREFEGPSSGIGSTYHWVANEEVGEGRMTITESRPPQLLAIRLEFLRPFVATHQVTFELSPHVAGTTAIDWTMAGENGFVGKAIGLVVDTDAIVGADFERGLDALEQVSEAQAAEAKSAAEAAAAAAAAEPPADGDPSAADDAAPAPQAP
jgi:uncharacterized protein YndB with AHSA1/START domain